MEVSACDRNLEASGTNQTVTFDRVNNVSRENGVLNVEIRTVDKWILDFREPTATTRCLL